MNDVQEGSKPVKDKIEPATCEEDEEDDCEGYFLQPTGNVNIAEKIAEANKKLLEEEEEDDIRPRKVQFSEDLVNFEPIYYSDEDCTESTRNSIISEEDVELKVPSEESKPEEREPESKEDEEIAEEIDLIEKSEEVSEEIETSQKLLLVLLPKEQNSSCESIIGEEVREEEKKEEKKPKMKIARPKSAKKSFEVSKISPNLNYILEKKSWERQCTLKTKKPGKEKKTNGGEIKVEIRGRFAKKINIDGLSLEERKVELRRCCDRPKSSSVGPKSFRRNEIIPNRPKTAPMKRSCCTLKTELPQYNGLRSEYGLSAEQLQERKKKTLELKHQRKQDKLKERQEEMRKKTKNEETFQKWLFNKNKKTMKKQSKVMTDTLTRSDVYIQTHASYAANRSVPYSVDYNLKRFKKNLKKRTILVEKLLERAPPHLKKSFNIYLGIRP